MNENEDWRCNTELKKYDIAATNTRPQSYTCAARSPCPSLPPKPSWITSTNFLSRWQISPTQTGILGKEKKVLQMQLLSLSKLYVICNTIVLCYISYTIYFSTFLSFLLYLFFPTLSLSYFSLIPFSHISHSLNTIHLNFSLLNEPLLLHLTFLTQPLFRIWCFGSTRFPLSSWIFILSGWKA